MDVSHSCGTTPRYPTTLAVQGVILYTLLSRISRPWTCAISMAATQGLQKQLQALSDEYQRLQAGALWLGNYPIQASDMCHESDLQSAVSAREKLEAQEQENMGVEKASLS